MTEPATAPQAPDEQQHEPRISYVVARLERAIRQAINERVKPYGLTTLQYTTLSVLGRRGELSNAQLARRAYMTPQSMSEVIEALEKQGPDRAQPAPEPPARLPGRATPTRAGGCSRPATTAVDELEQEMLARPRRTRSAASATGSCRRFRALHAGFPEK